MRKEQVVVVGAGIAGLATALSLHRFPPKPQTLFTINFCIMVFFFFWWIHEIEIFRLGVRSLVLEQSESLRVGGTSLTLFKNGWRVLDAMGVGDLLRTQFLEIQG